MACQDVGRKLRVSQDHSAQPDKVNSLLPQLSVRNRGEPLLQVAVARANHDEIRKSLFDEASQLKVAGHSYQRILRGLITVGGREQGRSLDVGIVVGAASGEADQPNG